MKSGHRQSLPQLLLLPVLLWAAALFSVPVLAIANDELVAGRDDPLVKKALEQPLPSDIAGMVRIQLLLAKLHYDEQADAVSALIERSMLLRMLGKPADEQQVPRESVSRAVGIRQANEKMSRQVLDSFRMEILAESIADDPVERKFFRKPDLYQGGNWTGHILFERGNYYVPIRVTYTAVGGVWNLSGKLELLPARGGKTYVLNLFGLEKRPFQARGTGFWTYAQLKDSKVGKAEFIAAINGLKTGDYHLKTRWIIAGVSLSGDATQPYLFLGPKAPRWSLWSSKHESLYTPDIEKSVTMRDELKCLARADEQAGMGERREGSPLKITGAADRRAEPNSPFMRALLKTRVSNNGDKLMESIALLSALNYPGEAERLSRHVELMTLWRALGKVSSSSETIETVLTRAAPPEPYLRAVRTCVLQHSAQASLPAGKPEEIAGLFRLQDSRHENHGVWSRERYGERILVVPLVIRNMAHTGFLRAEFEINPVSDRKDERVLLEAVRTGGSKTRPHDTLRMLATLKTSSPEISAERLGQLLAGKRDSGNLRTIARQITLYPFGKLHSPALSVSADRASWRNTRKYMPAAKEAVERADCTQMDNCTKKQSGGGLSNPYTWITVQIIITILPLLLIARARCALPWARIVYAAYWVVVVLVTLVSLVDRPGSSGSWSGIMTFTLAFFAGIPWSAVLAAPGGIVNTAVKSFFLSHDADLVLVWMGMAMNQLLLGVLAFWPARGNRAK